MGFRGDLSNPFKDVNVCKTWAYGIGGDVVATGVGVIQDAPEWGEGSPVPAILGGVTILFGGIVMATAVYA